ncbi:phenylacetate--CoA ligase family protein [Nocardia sp. NPDC058058]|uniref:phenylacetate--CoA ligase family protein n=1 Tax=Nocardia sp. NPDC058058 TaxID=3346317 RepID=UPI0036DA567E
MTEIATAAADPRSAADRMIAEISARETKPLEYWPAAALSEYVAEALPLSVAHAFESPFHRAKFAGTTAPVDLAEFERLPLTEPAEAKGRLRELLAVPWRDVAQINLSSGTTAGPTTYVAYTLEDLRGDGARYAPGGLFAFAATDLVAVALPYDMATVGLAVHRDVQRQGAVVLPAGKGGSYGPPERLLQAIHDLGVDTLFSTPSYAWYLRDLYEAAYPGEQPSIRHLRVGGEGAAPSMLTRLGQRWQADVRQWFGSTEIGIIAYTCELGVYHVAAGNCYAEVVDEAAFTGSPTSGAPGHNDEPATTPDAATTTSEATEREITAPEVTTPEVTQHGRPQVVGAGTVGALVFTTLGRNATPFVRFRSGDRGMLPGEPCECGRTLPTLHVYGRIADQIPAGDTAVSPYRIEEAFLQAVPEAAPWYHIVLRDNAIGLVAEWPGDAAGERAEVGDRVRDFVRRIAGFDLDSFEWAEIGTLDRPRTKMRRVRDERSIG